MSDVHTQSIAFFTDAGTGALKARRFVLEVMNGPDAGGRLELDEGTVIVGTSPEADLKLTDPTVSRHHLEIQVRVEGLRVADSGSRNGTFQGGTRIGTVIITQSVVLRLGRATELSITPLEEEVRLGSYEGAQLGPAIGTSGAMRELFALLERVAQSESSVLFEGETGTGKELLAEGVHQASPRARGPYIVVDCASLARDLAGSELFGHARGAFTGASDAKAGLAEEADGGTLFLDEIGELPLDLQPQLLRLIEKREVRRIGESRSRHVSVRFIAATHRDLRAEVRAGRFREDLYFRIAVVRARVPPLRERPDDIPFLVRHFLHLLGRPGFVPPPAILDELARHPWPGNVRELRNVVERGLKLEETLGEGESREGALVAARSSSASASGAAGGTSPGTDPGGAGVLDRPFKEAKNLLIESFEREYVAQLLAKHHGNISRAAQEAGIDRNYVHRLVKKYGLPIERS